MTRRILLALVGAYLFAAIATRTAEALGSHHECSCRAECWCNRRVLTVFRWGVPLSPRIELSHYRPEDPI